MKLGWLTDTHLDLVDDEVVDHLYGSMAALCPDAVLSGGDVGRSETFPDRLVKLAERVARPVYFVLGNHDYYGSSFAEARGTARELSRCHRRLHWLPDAGVVDLGDGAALIGHGLWGDGRAGNGERSKVELADHHLIEDLAGLPRDQLFSRLRALGDEAAAWVREHLERALGRADRVLLLTHVPPFAGPGMKIDRASSDDDLPFYICSAAATVILDVMEAHPSKVLTVVSGHRHLADEVDPAPNVHAITGGARYLSPALQGVIESGEPLKLSAKETAR